MAGQKYNKHMKPISKPSTVMVAIPPSGAPSASSISRSINTVMRWMPTLVQSGSILTSPKSGLDLGSLYESCNNQISDAIDAYSRAAELDPYNPHIKQRLELLKNVQENGGQLPSAPGPPGCTSHSLRDWCCTWRSRPRRSTYDGRRARPTWTWSSRWKTPL